MISLQKNFVFAKKKKSSLISYFIAFKFVSLATAIISYLFSVCRSDVQPDDLSVPSDSDSNSSVDPEPEPVPIPPPPPARSPESDPQPVKPPRSAASSSKTNHTNISNNSVDSDLFPTNVLSQQQEATTVKEIESVTVEDENVNDLLKNANPVEGMTVSKSWIGDLSSRFLDTPLFQEARR